MGSDNNTDISETTNGINVQESDSELSKKEFHTNLTLMVADTLEKVKELCVEFMERTQQQANKNQPKKFKPTKHHTAQWKNEVERNNRKCKKR